MQKQYSILVNAPIEVTFKCIDDKQKMQEWMYGQVKTEFKTSTDFSNPVGTKFHQSFAGLVDVDGEVVAFRPPVELGVGILVAGLKGTVFYKLSDIDPTHTKLDFNLEFFDTATAKKILLRTMMPVFNRVAKSYVESIKQLAEDSYVH
jgi:uncharacterized protein YndB with AHSA1/START domain